MIFYLLQSSICLLLFYIVYELMFRKHTSFIVNRVYLLSTLTLSVLIPWIRIETTNDTLANASSALLNSRTSVETISTSGISPTQLLLGVYLLGVILFLIIFLYKIFKLYELIKKGERVNHEKYRIVQTQQEFGVCSFLNYIIISKSHFVNEFELKHEANHINQYHSLDLLLAMIYQAVFWFNPVAYLYILKLKEVHEFLADRGAIQTLGKSAYQNHILTVLSQKLQPQLVHNFNSIIKTRLTMMNSNTKPSLGAYLSSLFVVCIALLLFSCHAKKAAWYVMSENGPVKVHSEIVIDTILTIDSDTYEEKITYEKKEIYYVVDTTVVIDYDTYEERVSIVKTFLEPEDLIKLKK